MCVCVCVCVCALCDFDEVGAERERERERVREIITHRGLWREIKGIKATQSAYLGCTQNLNILQKLSAERATRGVCVCITILVDLHITFAICDNYLIIIKARAQSLNL